MKVLAAVMLIGGRYLLRPVFRLLPVSGVREVHCRDVVAGAERRLIYGCAFGTVDGPEPSLPAFTAESEIPA